MSHDSPSRFWNRGPSMTIELITKALEVVVDVISKELDLKNM